MRQRLRVGETGDITSLVNRLFETLRLNDGGAIDALPVYLIYEGADRLVATFQIRASLAGDLQGVDAVHRTLRMGAGAYSRPLPSSFQPDLLLQKPGHEFMPRMAAGTSHRWGCKGPP